MFSFNRILGALPALLLFGSMAAVWAHLPAQVGNQESALELGKPIERELAGGQSHAYRIDLASGQFLQAVVEQRGINAALSLFGPDGKQLIELDNREGSRGAAELILWIAEAAGGYRLEVRSANKDAVAGRYEVKLEELRQARPQDASRVDAQKIFAEGEQLRAQGSAESLKKAQQKYEAALPHWRAAGDRVGEGLTLNSAGTVHFLLGEFQKSIDCLNQALSLFRAAGDQAGETVALYNIGATYNRLGDGQKALDYYSQALPLSRAAGNLFFEAYTLLGMGSVYEKSGEYKKALDYHNQALLLRRAAGDRRGEALTLNRIGLVYRAAGELGKALDYYNQALPLIHAVRDRINEGAMLYNIACVESDCGNFQDARAKVDEALKIAESLRNKIVSQELRSSFFATKQDYYELYIDLLMQQHKQEPRAGYDALALQAAERARARTLLEALTEARADIRQGIDPQLLERERSLQQQLSVKAERLVQLQSGKRTEEQKTAAEKEIDSITNEYQQVQAEIRQKSPGYAAITQPQPLSLKQIQQLLDSDTLLLEYSLGRERSYLWAVTPDSISGFELPKREEIETAARRVYALFSAGNQRVSNGSRQADQGRRIGRAYTRLYVCGSGSCSGQFVERER